MTTCGFTLAHYEDALRIAVARGRRFVAFGEAQAPGSTVYVRHDVDFSLAHARRMADVEAALGIQSTYFVQCNTPFYNLFEDETRDTIRQIHAAGHAVGLHLDERCRERGEELSAFAQRIYDMASRLIPLSRLVSFHRPTEAVLGRTIPDFISAYEGRYIGQGRYISDSRKQWRAGCMCAWLPQAPDGFQLLVHPEWWNTTDLATTAIGDDILSAKVDQLHQYMNANCQPFRGPAIERRVALTI